MAPNTLVNEAGWFTIEELERVALQRCTGAREAIRLLLKEVETPGEHRPSRITLDGTLIEGETVSDLN